MSKIYYIFPWGLCNVLCSSWGALGETRKVGLEGKANWCHDNHLGTPGILFLFVGHCCCGGGAQGLSALSEVPKGNPESCCPKVHD